MLFFRDAAQQHPASEASIAKKLHASPLQMIEQFFEQSTRANVAGLGFTSCSNIVQGFQSTLPGLQRNIRPFRGV